MVVGEPQILGQVRAAHRRAEEEGAVGPALTALFQTAVSAARRARAEGHLGAPPAAFIAAGLEEAEARLGAPLDGYPAVVVGAGRMALLAAEALRARGAGPVHVVNRTAARAASLAARAGGRAFALEDLPGVLAGVRVAVLCTAAPVPVVGRHDVAAAARREPLFLLDLAVPRNVIRRSVGWTASKSRTSTTCETGSRRVATPTTSPTSSAPEPSSPRSRAGSRNAGSPSGWRR